MGGRKQLRAQLIGKAVTENHAIVTVHQRLEQMENAGMWQERFSVSVNLGKVAGVNGEADDCLHCGVGDAEEVKLTITYFDRWANIST